MRILIIEDEKKLAGFIRRALREDGHAADHCHDGTEGAALAMGVNYDAIILDLQLPGRDGMSILREIREKKKSTAVLILTARDTVKDRVLGLNEGADDYLIKPFALDELRARVRAIFRRGSGTPATVLQYSDLTMKLLDRVVLRGSREITLTHREFSLLEYFLRNPGAVLSRTSIASITSAILSLISAGTPVSKSGWASETMSASVSSGRRAASRRRTYPARSSSTMVASP